ncbi:hypothetical protein E2C01_095284 [Portunus trituberculatus]|uniref:Uncharacterized protein n=1 Tax=Portunus trituberculatus TaxID=210409 RepID=A0A5B7JZS4_PORTR|nr:hypothetical protein [Portunus trituberculatus]
MLETKRYHLEQKRREEEKRRLSCDSDPAGNKVRCGSVQCGVTCAAEGNHPVVRGWSVNQLISFHYYHASEEKLIKQTSKKIKRHMQRPHLL